MNNIRPSYKLCKFESDECIVKLPASTINELKIDISNPLVLKFGNSVTSGNIVQTDLNDSTGIQLSKQLFQELRIPGNINVSVKPLGKNEIRLGPVIGILTFPRTYANKHFGFYLNYQVTLKSGFMFVFSSYGVNPKTETIKAHYFNPSTRTWLPAELPYPDVVIDRCYPNAYWAHKQLERVIGKGRIFNKKTMITKLDFYTALQENKVLKKHLPETRLCSGTADLEYFLNKYDEIFLKPLGGMQGMGIITASLENNAVKCRLMAKGDVVEKEMSNPAQILDLLRVFGHPRRRYIIQSAVSRMGYQGQPFCFRVMAMKNDRGKWLVPAIFTNAAKGNSFLTNHAAGASRFISLNNLFNDIEGRLKNNRIKFLDLMTELSIKTAETLDKKYGPLGELGLDVVVDQSGKPYFLEANGNPGMVPRSHMVDYPKWAYQVFNLPVSFAVYLSGFDY